MQFEEATAESTEKLAAEKKLNKALQARACSPPGDRILRTRDLKFEELLVIPAHIDPKKNAKDKLQMDLITAFEESRERGRFLAQQLKEVQDTLVYAQQGWQMTVKSDAGADHGAGKRELEELKRAVKESKSQVPFDHSSSITRRRNCERSGPPERVLCGRLLFPFASSFPPLFFRALAFSPSKLVLS